jgi:hypothetical protein
LLYDRNTNHLVEADSLACNRTFIDYWEPVTGPQPAVGPQARSTKPRIAPSIPMTTTDPRGERGVFTGNTPAGGTPAVMPDGSAKAAKSREAPQLSLVTPDYEADEVEAPDEAAKTTRQLAYVPSPPDLFGEAEAEAPAVETPTKKRKPKSSAGAAGLLSSTRNRVILILGVIVALAALGGGTLFVQGQQPGNMGAVEPTPSATQPLPTPTGFGEATPTPPPTPVPPPPPPTDVIAVGGWVEVTTTGLNVRETPNASGRRVAVMPGGTKAHVVEGPVEAGGRTWWRLDQFDPNNPSLSGWSAAEFLKPIPPP